MIAASTLAQADGYATAFAGAAPFRHVVIDGFLDEAFCTRLRTDFPPFEDRHALNEHGQVGGKAVRMDVRGIAPSYAEFDAYLQSRQFLDFVGRATGIPDLLYDPDYIGGGTHENRHGQGLDAHVDFNYHPRTRWHRRLNLIVYLNERWQEGWGGALELHSDPWNAAANRSLAVAPAFNRCVIFETTENSWHGFAPIDLPEAERAQSRKSFAIYLYTRERAPEETAPPHATIYVPDSSPSTWAAGRCLDEDDRRRLVRGFSGMRTQLRYLYDREKHFGAQIAALEHALGEARAAQRLELQGYATQPRGASGLWPDGWAGARLDAAIVPTRALRSLRLKVWIPDALSEAQHLTIRFGDTRTEQRAQPGKIAVLDIASRAPAGSELILAIDAAHTWTPSRDPGGDQRALAYKLVSAELVH